MKALVLAVVTLVVYARIVLGGGTWDDVRYHIDVAPPRLAAAEAVLAGEAPTWWDGSGLGVPLLGEPSHGAAYPLTWLAADPRALDLLVLVHLFWLALGVVLWSRRLGASELASLVAGVIVGASGIALATGLRGALPALAYVPWVAWAALGSSRRHAALLGLFIGAIGLAGGSLAILVDALLLVAVLTARRPCARWMALAALGGVAIAAAQWLPAFAILGDSTGATLTALKPSRLLELLIPGTFGGTGKHAVAAIAGSAPHLPGLFIGATTFALATLARPSRRMLAAGATFAILALVVGRGGAWPHWLGAPELHLATLAIVAAPHAAVGIDALFERERRALVALAGAGVATLLAVIAIAVLRSRDPVDALDRALLDGAVTVVCIVIGLAIAWRAPRDAWAPLALSALLVAPSVASLGGSGPVTMRAHVETAPLWAESARGAIDPTNPRAPLRLYRPISLFEQQDTELPDAIATLAGASAARYGLATARSEDPARPRIHDRLYLASSSSGGALLERYSIQLAILPVSLVEGRKFVGLATRGQWTLAKYPATPPAAMVFEWLWLPDDDTTVARLFPPGAGLGLPAGLVVLRGTGPEHQEEPRAPEPCTISRWARGAIDMTCGNQEPAYAVVSSTNARGWNVEVDGRDTPWVTADLMRRAVRLEPGTHVVSWRYAAPGVILGVSLALTALLALLALLALSFVRAKREAGPDEN